MYDFRAVSILPTAAAGLWGQVAQLHSYGEIAGVSLCEGDLTVEFYDMRAAQQVAMSISASRPRYQKPEGLSSKIPEPCCPSDEWVQETVTTSSGPLPGKERRTPATPVSKKDRPKLDIVPDKIRSGDDMRTTVLVRHIPEACSRDAFLELLETCGLSESYTFFYMPLGDDMNPKRVCGSYPLIVGILVV